MDVKTTMTISENSPVFDQILRSFFNLQIMFRVHTCFIIVDTQIRSQTQTSNDHYNIILTVQPAWYYL